MAGELLTIFLLMVLNGIFAMAEMSLVSSRKSRLQGFADQGKNGARIALELLNDPERFLSTVQIGITLVGIVAGAYGGLMLAEDLTPVIAGIPRLEEAAYEIALVSVVSCITYLSLVIGELIPKSLALNNPEAFAMVLAPPMRILSIMAKPLVFGLSSSTRFLIRILRIPRPQRVPVTDHELILLIQQGTQAGAIEQGESDMMQRVLRLGDRTAASVMTPRKDVIWLDIGDSWEATQRTITESKYTKFPVCDGGLDNVIGILTLTNYTRALPSGPVDLRSLVEEALFIPEHLTASKVLERFREKKVYVGVVIDEYGDVEGLVTLHNLVESVLGDLPEAEDGGDQAIFRREDGSWLVDGSLPLERLRESVVQDLELREAGHFSTVSGLMMFHLNRIPAIGNVVHLGSYTFEIVDMDGKRVDKVLVRKREDSNLSAGGRG